MYRRNNGRTATIHRRVDGRPADFVADNRWVAPYNPFISELMDCHVNVEVVCSIKAVKYVYKYVYKGHDRTQVRLEGQASVPIQAREGPVEHDEIAQYIDAR